MQTVSILVTGATGTLGRLVVARLRAIDRPVRALSRSDRTSEDGTEWIAGDLETGRGIDAAVEGVETIIHCAGNPTGDAETTQTLVRAAARAGAPHIVFISVVGADDVPLAGRVDRAMFGYFGSKRGAEQVVTASGLPWTTVRATQFHELLFTVAEQMSKLPIVPVAAGFRFQPVAAEEVAMRLVELALGPPSGLVPDVAGPRLYGMRELIRAYLRASGKHRLILPIPLPGRAARAFRAGVNLAPERAVGRRTWEEFLVARLGREDRSVRSVSQKPPRGRPGVAAGRSKSSS